MSSLGRRVALAMESASTCFADSPAATARRLSLILAIIAMILLVVNSVRLTRNVFKKNATLKFEFSLLFSFRPFIQIASSTVSA